MSDKKQIEEMAKVLKDYTKENHIMASHTILENYAEALYNAGYSKQEWISVDDRLPETEGKYLVCTANVNIGVGNFIDYYGTGKRICFDTWAISHWMPLPEPPKGE